MSEGFIKLMRSRATRELLQDGSAFLLLTLIAWRAKRTNDFSVHGLTIGQALIGDHQACGLTARQYRSAKARLQRYGLAAFRTTNRGTVATLLDTAVYDINEEAAQEPKDKPKASQRQAADNPVTTNKNDKNEKNGKGTSSLDVSRSPLTFEEIRCARAREAFEQAKQEFIAND